MPLKSFSGTIWLFKIAKQVGTKFLTKLSTRGVYTLALAAGIILISVKAYDPDQIRWIIELLAEEPASQLETLR